MTTLAQTDPAAQHALLNLKNGAAELSIIARRAQEAADALPALMADLDNRNSIKAASNVEVLWELAHRTGAFREPQAQYTARTAAHEIQMLRDHKQPQDPAWLAQSANRAIAMMFRLLASALEAAPDNVPGNVPENRAAQPKTRYPVIIQPGERPETTWQDELMHAGGTPMEVYVIGSMTREQHRRVAGHQHIESDLGYLRSHPEGPTVLDIHLAHQDASAMADAWRTQTSEEWEATPLGELDPPALLALINTVNEALDSEMDVAYERFDDEFVARHRDAWAMFMRPAATVTRQDAPPGD